MSNPSPSAILIIDDNSINRDVLTHQLKRLEHSVIGVSNGRQALALLMARKFDLILLDLVMPDMHGLQLLESLKADELTKHIPVVVVSSLDDIENIARCIELGAEDYLHRPFNPVLLRARVGACLEKYRMRLQEQSMLEQLKKEKAQADKLIELVIPLGVALSAEREFDRLLESILLDAKVVCNADGGTLYLKTAENYLRFEIMRNDSLNVALGGTTGRPVPYAPLPMYDPFTGEPNHHNVATHAALTAQSVNIADAYTAEGFDFSGTKTFDRQNGYRSRSFLAIPLKNHYNEVLGVLQMINARDMDTGLAVVFETGVQKMVESLSALATVALESYIREQQLRTQIQELKIAIDETRKSAQVADIVETDYFQVLQKRAKQLRQGKR